MLIVPLDASWATPALLVMCVAAITLLLLDKALGPFSHQKFIHLHRHYHQWPKSSRLVLQFMSWMVITVSFSHILGIWQFQTDFA